MLKIKDYIIPITLAFSSTLLIQYYFFSGNSTNNNTNVTQLESGRSHLAPRVKEVHRPLDLDIDFDTKTENDVQKTLIETDYAKYLFSSHGACIEQLEYKHIVSGKEILLKAVDTQAKENKCLLVAFNKKTPFYYSLANKEEFKDNTILTYRADFEGGFITKKFIVYKNLCKVDMEISILPLEALKEAIRLRVFCPSPNISDIKNDLIQGIMNEGNTIIKKGISSLLQRYWEAPSLFGLEDKYFIHSMTGDHNKFTQRGYYKSLASNLYFSILEGPSITDKSSWAFSFYFGPKKIKTICAVDSRLESTLDYGYLGIISKPLLSILNFFYLYFKNYGIAIILLTLLIKLLLLPFTIKGEQSMKKRLEFQKKLQYIQHKYKDDTQALTLARTELLKKHGISDVAGCLPLLLQLPIFFALNRVLSTAIELYGAPFLWIPSLAAPDPYYILPLIIGLSIIAHSQSVDPRQRFTSYAMALLLAAFSVTLPSGLSLFIFMSSLLTVVQTKIYSMFKKA